MPRHPRNILCIRFSALGDIALAIPAVYDACRSNPDMRFVFLTRKHPAALFINAPANLRVVGVDLNLYKGVAGLARLAKEMVRDYGIDTVVDLHDVLRTKVIRNLLRLRGARVAAIRKGRKEKRLITRSKNKVMRPLTPVTERYADTFRRAGISLTPHFRSVYGSGKGAPEAFASISEPKGEGCHWIAVAPFARHEGKIYPLEMMEKVINILAARPGIRIFLFGAGEKERETLAGWADGHENVVNVAAVSPGLAGEAALISHCDVMLSMDSANMHIASLTATPVVSVWGATHPFIGFMGFGQKEENAVQLDMPCRPCSVFGNKPCLRGDYQCMRGINPQIIADRVISLLP